jgi:V-type H+-transporting ATPase subunit a
MFSMIYGGRYIILLMGFWSMYVGLVYNDVFSLGLEIFGGMQWEFWGEHQQRGYQTGVYSFGVDPAWAHASNKLLFVNSYKMKQAILLGVVHVSRREGLTRNEHVLILLDFLR